MEPTSLVESRAIVLNRSEPASAPTIESLQTKGLQTRSIMTKQILWTRSNRDRSIAVLVTIAAITNVTDFESQFLLNERLVSNDPRVSWSIRWQDNRLGDFQAFEFGTFVLPFAILSFLPLRSKANILLAKKSLNIASLLCIRVCDSLTDSQPRNYKLYRATISKRRSPSKIAPIGCALRATLMIEIWTHFEAPSSSKLFDAYLPFGFKQVRICSP